MRHRVAGHRLKRSRGHRRALFRNLIADLFRHRRIRTTEAKARAVRAEAEKLITVAKRSLDKENDVHERRQVARTITDKEVVRELFDTIAPEYRDRPGGYTRIIKLGPRQGDAAPMAILELVE
ncbi:MAG: 50S ribosomal protein L17 [Anaerolineae bacterium]|nr:50S ribosomal protein L17 [Anaerolineae bacterium]NIN97885.1 50S ribosomal protein L17 [Anaerolineae bacterium]NIQ80864.1 50S ribosomal protein L17 [Anaerolineae bacterium]